MKKKKKKKKRKKTPQPLLVHGYPEVGGEARGQTEEDRHQQPTTFVKILI